MNAEGRKQVSIYLIDQDRETTTSLGIFHFCRNLVSALAETPDPGFDVVLWVSSSNEKDFVPAAMPSWMSTRTVRGRFGTGLGRVWADQVLAPWMEQRERVDAVHYPKGWTPFVRTCRTKRIATLHDTIVQYYRSHYPRFFPLLKLWYFDISARHSLHKADRVITSSRASAAALGKLTRRQADEIDVVPTGLMRVDDAPSAVQREGILILGSRLPHKSTAETLKLLKGYQKEAGDITVTVTGITGWNDIGGGPPEFDLEVNFVGRVSDTRLQDLMRTSRALVILSEIEGFGLPVLEAYACATPVCYRNTSSLAELLDGVPGGWDGQTEESFVHAMNETLAMTREEIKRTQDRFLAQYNAHSVAGKMISIYGEVLSGSRERKGDGA